jgi:ArsR family transcriptional regulator, virulence genes transcriptional regulator
MEDKIDITKLETGAKSATACLKALAHELRLMAICYIGDGERSVQELETRLNTSQSNVSQHLGKLRDKGILDTEKRGNQVFYRVADKRVLELIKVLQNGYC